MRDKLGMAMPVDDAVLNRSAVELATMIARGDISSEELTRIALARIARWNPTLHAFVTVGERRALHAARRRDAARRKMAVLPPFWGVPTGIKDLNVARDFATTFGSSHPRLPYLPIDDRLVARMRAAGFVIVGKLATSEVGALPVTEPQTHPPTLSPWSVGATPADAPGPAGLRSAGGSSGGSGSAVAARMIPIAPGSDGAGSIRIPAAFNGLVGIKPSRGVVANAFGLSDKTILYTDGPIARSVADAAHLLDALAGHTVGARAWAPASPITFAAATSQAPRPLRIRVATDHALAVTDPALRAATLRVAETLAALGHHVDAGTWLQTPLAEFVPIWQHAVADSRMVIRRRGMAPVTAWLHQTGKHIRRAQTEARKADLTRRVNDWFGDADVWLSPTVSSVAPPLGLADGADGQAAFLRAAPLGGFTALFNLNGAPAISVPVGVDGNGLPLGVQLAGRLHHDATLISLAAQLERALGVMPPPPLASTCAR